jgi:predicted dithiol-disulfide oxidoreductase (DUF899 family)
MSTHTIATREEWLAARDELLVREKEHTRTADALARQRRELPWLPVEKDYRFDTESGPMTLAELFDGRSQLVVYNFMFGPSWEAGCPVCSSIADSFNGVLSHLRARDVTMICISRAPIEKLLAYRERMGWSFNWASSYESEFNYDFDRTMTDDIVAAWVEQAPPLVSKFAADCGTDLASFMAERPGLCVFTRDGDDVYLTYSTTARGLEPVMVYYGILDRVPNGRDEGEPSSPAWIRRHDEFALA